MKARYLIMFFVALVLHLQAKAQIFNDSITSADTVWTVSLLTAAPGTEIYQLEGHSGLRFQSCAGDFVANWGLFDFRAPNFVYRFVKGETDYRVGITDTESFLAGYAEDGRRVTAQVLNLTPAQADTLLQLVFVAIRPENRTYRYNYVLDNCATRPLSFIERATGQRVHFRGHSARVDSVTTFRNVMRRFHKNYPWYQFGIDMALGSGIDSTITARSTAFAPVILEELAATATLGSDTPLVRSTQILVPGSAEGSISPPTPWFLTPLAVMWLIGCISLLSVFVAHTYPKVRNVWMSVFFISVGLAGCVISFLVFVSVHESTSPNWLILWLNPLCLCVPAFIFWRGGSGFLRWYFRLNLFMLALYSITWAFGQQSANPAFLPLFLSDLFLSVSYLRHAK